MSTSPACLYEYCLNYICKNLKIISFENSDSEIKFRNKKIQLNHVISSDLLEKLCEKEKVDDKILTLFDNSQTQLNRARIQNATLSLSALKLFLSRNLITDLTINNIRLTTSDNLSSHNPIFFDQLFDCLAIESFKHLRSLNISRNVFTYNASLFNRLRSLRRINVSYTSFDDQSLEVVCKQLNNLESLDISATHVSDFKPLKNLSNTLRFLFIYNMRSVLDNQIIGILCGLAKLQSLDVSCDVSSQIFAESLPFLDVNMFLSALTVAKLTNLSYLDISGRTEVQKDCLCSFLEAYPNLSFIGLAFTSSSSFVNTLTMRNLVSTGESSLEQLIHSLKAYKTRHMYVQKSMIFLYKLIVSNQALNYPLQNTELLELIIELMSLHDTSQSVQLAATSCIHYLLLRKIPIAARTATRLVNAILHVMKHFWNKIVLNNCLLILETGREILDKFKFRKCDCVKVMLENILLVNNTEQGDLMVDRISSMFSRVAFNAEPRSRSKFQHLANAQYANGLINILKLAMKNSSNDLLLHSVLELMWTLSEGSSEWSCHFITQNCLDYLMRLLELFSDDKVFVYKTVGLIYNFSEIKTIRPILFGHGISKVIAKLIHDNEVRISFMAVGVFTNLLAHLPKEHWDWRCSAFKTIETEKFCEKLEDIIDYGQEYLLQNNFCMNHYSVGYLIGLMQMTDMRLVQLWSLLAVLNLYQGKYDRGFFEDENVKVYTALNEMKLNENTHTKVKDLCKYGLELLKKLS